MGIGETVNKQTIVLTVCDIILRLACRIIHEIYKWAWSENIFSYDVAHIVSYYFCSIIRKTYP